MVLSSPEGGGHDTTNILGISALVPTSAAYLLELKDRCEDECTPEHFKEEKMTKHIVTVCLVVVVASSVAHGTTLIVPSIAYPTLASALQSASSGDTVRIVAGTTLTENVAVSAPVTITTNALNPARLKRANDAQPMLACTNANGFCLQNLVIDGEDVATDTTTSAIILTNCHGRLENVTIQGVHETQGATDEGGGAIRMRGGIQGASFVMRFDECIFTGNSSDTRGGAVDIEDVSNADEDHPIVFDACVFDGNSASESIYYSDGMCLGGGIAVNRAYVVLQNTCEFYDNTAMHGGAISGYHRWTDGATPFGIEILDCVFEGNHTPVYNERAPFDETGGAVHAAGCMGQHCQYVSYYGELTIDGCEFTANGAGKAGGAVFLKNMDARISDSEFYGNYTSNPRAVGGGAIFAACNKSLRVEGSCVFANNRADYGGDCTSAEGGAVNVAFAYVMGDLNGKCPSEPWEDIEVSIENSTFERNSAGWGGAVAVGALMFTGTAGMWQDSTDVVIDGCSFSENEASMGGGGLYMLRHGSVLAEETVWRISDNTFTANSASPLLPFYVKDMLRLCGGGGVLLYGPSPELVFEGNDVSENTSTSLGGGLLCNNLENGTIVENTFDGNEVYADADPDDIGNLQYGTYCESVYGEFEGAEYESYNAMWYGRGGAMFFDHLIGTVERNVIVNNAVVVADGHGGAGGGIALQTQPTSITRFSENFVVNNTVERESGSAVAMNGGGIHHEHMDDEAGWGPEPGPYDYNECEWKNNVVLSNEAEDGGGVFIEEESDDFAFANNVVAYNSASGAGDGVYVNHELGEVSNPAKYVYNNLYNAGDDWAGPTGTQFTWNTMSGFGNIDDEPEFRSYNPASGDNDPCDVLLKCSSPCVDGGDPAGDEDDCDGSVVDIGMHGGDYDCDKENTCGIPLISDIQAEDVEGSWDCTVEVSWSTDVAAISQIEFYDPLLQRVRTLPTNPTEETEHAVEFEYEDDHSYYITVRSHRTSGGTEDPFACQTVEDSFQLDCGSDQVHARTSGGSGRYEMRFYGRHDEGRGGSIFSVDGREVVRLQASNDSNGEVLVYRWDGRGADGRRVCPGIYFFRLKDERSEPTRRLLVVHGR